MAHMTGDAPKALLPVLGRPFAARQMDWLAAQAVSNVVYSVGYRGDMIRAVLGDGSAWGIPIHYVDEGQHLRGTAGALRLAADQDVLEAAFMVLYGDSYLCVDLNALWRTFARSRWPAVMTVFRNDGQWDTSNVIYRDGQVVLYDKAAAARAELVHIDYGLSVLSREIIRTNIAPGDVADLADLYHHLSVTGQLGGFEVHDRFYEIGSEEGLRSLEAHLSRAASAPRS